jgi:hypothetical protein
MAQYTVISDKTTLGKPGTAVDSKDLEGYNVDALIEGGHIAVATSKKTETPDPAKDK